MTKSSTSKTKYTVQVITGSSETIDSYNFLRLKDAVQAFDGLFSHYNCTTPPVFVALMESNFLATKMLLFIRTAQ